MVDSSNEENGIFLSIPDSETGKFPDGDLLGPYAVRARLVRIRIDNARLRAAGEGRPSGFRLNLFPVGERAILSSTSHARAPIEVVAVFDKSRMDGGGGTVWFGHIVDDIGSSVILADQRGVFSVDLDSPRYGMHSVELLSGQADLYVVREFDEDAIPECGVEDDLELDGEEEEDHSGSVSEDNGSIIDLMVVYTRDVKAALRNEAEVKRRIDKALCIANEILERSNLTPILNLVHYRELPGYSEKKGKGGYYVMLSELEWGVAKGLEKLHALRDQHRADIVTLLVANDKLGGLANVPPESPSKLWGKRAYNVVNYYWAAKSYTMFHEIAHNFGCCHETGCKHASTWARGHRFEVNKHRLKTVMVKKSVPGQRVMHLSNPDVNYQKSNVPTGKSDRNNAKVLRDNAKTVANFRTRAVGGNLLRSWSSEILKRIRQRKWT